MNGIVKMLISMLNKICAECTNHDYLFIYSFIVCVCVYKMKNKQYAV